MSFRVLFLVFSCFWAVSGALYAAAFRHLDDMLAASYVPTEDPRASFLRPMAAQAARNMVLSHRKVDCDMPAFTDVMLVPHRRSLGMIVSLPEARGMDHPTTYGFSLISFFFPGQDEFSVNTISRLDPVGKLNRLMHGEAKKDEISHRLGNIVRVVVDALTRDAPIEEEALVGQILTAWGQNPGKQFVLSPEAFAHYALLLGLEEGTQNLRTLIEGVSQGFAETIEEMDVPPPLLGLFQQARAQGVSMKDLIQCPFSPFYQSPLVADAWIDPYCAMAPQKRVYLGQTMSDKNLMALWKRHIAIVMARSIGEDRARPTPYSLTLATIMTFFWETYENGAGLKAFYQGVLPEHFRALEWDVAQAEETYTLDAARPEIERLKKEGPKAFFALPPAQQVAYLRLDQSQTVFELPTSGMANAAKQTYSDCVGSMTRNGLYEALRPEDATEVAVDRIPEGPFKEFFTTYSGRNRMTREARDAWAVATQEVKRAVRVQAGGLEPSVENLVLLLQHMMGDEALVVRKIDSEEAFQAARGRYKAFLTRFNAWLSAAMGYEIAFTIEDDHVRWTDGRRTTGSVGLRVAGKNRGNLRVDPGHGEFDQEGKIDFFAAAEGTDLVSVLGRAMYQSTRSDAQDLDGPTEAEAYVDQSEDLLRLLPFLPQNRQLSFLEALPDEAQTFAVAHLPVVPWVFTSIPHLIGPVVRGADPELVDIFLRYCVGAHKPNYSYTGHYEPAIRDIIKGGEEDARRTLQRILDVLITRRPSFFQEISVGHNEPPFYTMYSLLGAALKLGMEDQVCEYVAPCLTGLVLNLSALKDEVVGPAVMRLIGACTALDDLRVTFPFSSLEESFAPFGGAEAFAAMCGPLVAQMKGSQRIHLNIEIFGASTEAELGALVALTPPQAKRVWVGGWRVPNEETPPWDENFPTEAARLRALMAELRPDVALFLQNPDGEGMDGPAEPIDPLDGTYDETKGVEGEKAMAVKGAS